MLKAEQLESLVAHVDAAAVQAVLLIGSYARGDAGPYSDVDLLRLVPAALTGAGGYLWEDKPVNVSDADPETVEAWFAEPEQAVDVVAGLRDARVLYDRGGIGEALKARARTFSWTPDLQQKADVWASRQLASWAEEAHKGLGGLQTGDTGRLLHAQFGLSWGLARTVRVQWGLLSRGDNTFLTDLGAAFAGTRWLALLHDTYGLTGLALPERVRAGLELYALTAELLDDALQDADRPLIAHTVRLIRENG